MFLVEELLFTQAIDPREYVLDRLCHLDRRAMTQASASPLCAPSVHTVRAQNLPLPDNSFGRTGSMRLK